MLSLSDISAADNICIYSNKVVCIQSDGESYWFSQDGFPWGTRENISFLQRSGLDELDYRILDCREAAKLLAAWKEQLNIHG